MKTFGENLRDRRRLWGIRQKELAKTIGVSVNTLLNYERGYTFPDVLIAHELAQALYCTVDYLLTGKEN